MLLRLLRSLRQVVSRLDDAAEGVIRTLNRLDGSPPPIRRLDHAPGGQVDNITSPRPDKPGQSGPKGTHNVTSPKPDKQITNYRSDKSIIDGVEYTHYAEIDRHPHRYRSDLGCWVPNSIPPDLFKICESPLKPTQTKPPLAHVIDTHQAPQGFTGVVNLSDDRLLVVPSSDADPLPPGFVSQFGGHEDVSISMGGDPDNH